MTTDLARFRRTLEDAVEAEMSAHTDQLANAIVTSLWNSVDDERGRLADQVRVLHKEKHALIKEVAVLHSMNAMLERSLGIPDEPPTDDEPVIA